MNYDSFFNLCCFLISIAIGIVIGFSFSSKLYLKYRRCVSINCLLRRISFLIGYRYDDVFMMCYELKNDSELNNLLFLNDLPERYESGSDFRSCWELSVKSQKYDKDEERILLSLGSIIGKSDGSSQLDSISALKVSLLDIEKRRNEEYLRLGRLYRCLGFLFGLMVGILII